MFLSVEWAKRWLPKVFFLLFVLVVLAVVSTLISYYYQVEVAQIADLYLNDRPANLYAVICHGYPLHWARTTHPIPLEVLDPQLFQHPQPVASLTRALIIGFRPILRNFFLDVLFYLGIYSTVALLFVIYRIRKNWRTKSIQL
jgi:hypothetical protein